MGVWARVAQMIPGRKSWQCRERFTRHVDPRIDRNNGWTWEEDVRLVKAVKRAGTYAWVCQCGILTSLSDWSILSGLLTAPLIGQSSRGF